MSLVSSLQRSVSPLADLQAEGKMEEREGEIVSVMTGRQMIQITKRTTEQLSGVAASSKAAEVTWSHIETISMTTQGRGGEL